MRMLMIIQTITDSYDNFLFNEQELYFSTSINFLLFMNVHNSDIKKGLLELGKHAVKKGTAKLETRK